MNLNFTGFERKVRGKIFKSQIISDHLIFGQEFFFVFKTNPFICLAATAKSEMGTTEKYSTFSEFGILFVRDRAKSEV